MAAGRAGNQPADGDVAVKTEEDQAADGEDEEELEVKKLGLLISMLSIYEFMIRFFFIKQKLTTDNGEAWSEVTL